MSSVELLQSNNGGRLILEDAVSSDHLPANIFYPPAPDDHNYQPNARAEDEAKKMQWFSGFLHIMHQVVNIFMIIPLQLGIRSPFTVPKIEVIKVDNNGIRSSPKLDTGVACACRSCSLYNICKRKCPRTADQSGASAGLPILCESDKEHMLESTNVNVKRHVDAIRSKRAENTCRIDKKYRCLLMQFTHHLSQLIKEKKLPYNRLKRWVYILRPQVQMEIKEREPPIDKMLNSFYQHWFATVCLWELIMEVKKCIKEPLPIVEALEIFESEVDDYFSNRLSLHGSGSNGEPIALLCLDPEWHCYPAGELYQLQKRACEALQRKRGQTFTVYFCTLLKECMLLRHVEIFVHKMKKVIAKESGGESIDDLAILHSTDVVYVESRSVFVLGINPSYGFTTVPQSVGCSCSQLDRAASGGHKYAMPECNKYFTYNYGP